MRRRHTKNKTFIRGRGKVWTTTQITNERELKRLQKTLQNEEVRNNENKRIKKIKDDIERKRVESHSDWKTTPMDNKQRSELLQQEQYENQRINSRKQKKKKLTIGDL